MMFPKKKNVRLHGKAKTELREAIFARDGGKCVVCGRNATEWHHQPFGVSKSDEIEKGVALCKQCHTDLHGHPKLGRIYYNVVQEYLRGLYGYRNN